ncbi:glycoside hydrolase family 25 protein [Diplocloster modestus]|uniref:Glycoside hydrolase family 25 protein n=1 Tax=Diplocloster modestus TaxID=2850322 RepID=A0ABS6KEL2_9FIRM|nr:glycoside hydrolase family 25 protein [Diplocloster modestus]MBU9728958.1 glycoside hydrolase family 25 protein [Diplocloster modestus]
MYNGIDLSYHNGSVNFSGVKDAGYRYVILRAGYGKNNIDQAFERYASTCLNLDIPFGIYWFSYALNEDMARQEARCAIESVRQYKTKCLIAYDLEYDSVQYARTKGVNIDRALATEMARVFCEEVASAGYIPVLYSNRDYLINYFDLDRIDAYLWYARYTSTLSDSEKFSCAIWQKTSSGKVPGISGKVDVNEFYMDFENAAAPEENGPSTPQSPACDLHVLLFQKAANADGYRDMNGQPLVEDGLDGPKTRYVRKKIALKAKKSGLKISVGSKGELVKYWQTRSNEILGTSIKVDGYFGKETHTNTGAIQDKLNLSKDYIAGYNSLTAVLYN